MKDFKGKIIYNPSGKAKEYSYWAANFYNGCSGDCEYCYMKKPPLNQCWSNTPTLKKSLKDEEKAIEIFSKEVGKNLDSLREHGLFFNFNSDPFLESSYQLNYYCINFCILWGIPIKILTKQTWWIDNFKSPHPLVNIGFTLTGHDELEPGCATNSERILAMKTLKKRGFKTWASIEPIIDIDASLDMIVKTMYYCDHYKIGLKSETKYNINELNDLIPSVHDYISVPIYWKDDLLKQAEIKRENLPSNCVGRNFLLE